MRQTKHDRAPATFLFTLLFVSSLLSGVHELLIRFFAIIDISKKEFGSKYYAENEIISLKIKPLKTPLHLQSPF